MKGFSAQLLWGGLNALQMIELMELQNVTMPSNTEQTMQ
jgi:hypothetical protein